MGDEFDVDPDTGEILQPPAHLPQGPVPTADSPRELASTSRAVANPLDLPIEVFQASLDRRGENRKRLMKWIGEALVEGVDYGKVHVAKNCPDKYHCKNPYHYSKDSLRKPGSEKISGMLGLVATFPRLADYENAAITGGDIQTVVLRCHLSTASGSIVGDGIGARRVAQDGGDLNKAMKMAMKSAMIDAIIRVAGISEVFTQDVEDMIDAGGGGGTASAASSTAPSGPSPSPPPAPPKIGPDEYPPSGKHAEKAQEPLRWRDIPDSYLHYIIQNGSKKGMMYKGAEAEQERRKTTGDTAQERPRKGSSRATDAQIRLVEDRLAEGGIAVGEFCMAMHIDGVDVLPFEQVDEALEWIKEHRTNFNEDVPF